MREQTDIKRQDEEDDKLLRLLGFAIELEKIRAMKKETAKK